jgi:hypothetical protein
MARQGFGLFVPLPAYPQVRQIVSELGETAQCRGSGETGHLPQGSPEAIKNGTLGRLRTVSAVSLPSTWRRA